jgi:hypothetical protein
LARGSPIYAAELAMDDGYGGEYLVIANTEGMWLKTKYLA